MLGYGVACGTVFMNVMVRSKKGIKDTFLMKRTVNGRASWKKPKRRLRAFRQLGVEESWARRFAYSRLGSWRIACSPIM